MPTVDTSNIKEKIMSTIKFKGPSLPVHISQATGQSMLFASAFLSELLSEKKIKTSNMRVGSSPLYLIPGQEPQLEKFAQEHLKSKEKDAFIRLKEKGFLKDYDQEPAIRVALRAIKDFAIPIQKQDGVYWKYLTASEEEIAPEGIPEEQPKEIIEETKEPIKEEETPQENKPEEVIATLSEQEGNEDPSEEEISKPKPIKKKVTKKKTIKKQDDKFFNKVKEFLIEKGVEILDIQSFSKTDLALKIKEDNQEKMLIAYNKKRITDADLVKAYKKAQEESLPYVVLSLGEPAKKLSNLIETIKNMDKLETIN
jgi:hypothetical protein